MPFWLSGGRPQYCSFNSGERTSGLRFTLFLLFSGSRPRDYVSPFPAFFRGRTSGLCFTLSPVFSGSRPPKRRYHRGPYGCSTPVGRLFFFFCFLLSPFPHGLWEINGLYSFIPPYQTGGSVSFGGIGGGGCGSGSLSPGVDLWSIPNSHPTVGGWAAGNSPFYCATVLSPSCNLR